MFAPKEKPLPVAVLKPEPNKNTQLIEPEFGIRKRAGSNMKYLNVCYK